VSAALSWRGSQRSPRKQDAYGTSASQLTHNGTANGFFDRQARREYFCTKMGQYVLGGKQDAPLPVFELWLLGGLNYFLQMYIKVLSRAV
jgi:hypothetical protein